MTLPSVTKTCVIIAELDDNNASTGTLENDEDSLGGMNKSTTKLKLPGIPSPAKGGSVKGGSVTSK
jgi:hypothetical protein